ncbi:uracil phosphoribosyltransferase [Desulfurispirillum indicum]|uniref:Uracil phosphoribosyltransferase n=1 Tax=Desulfurispirillum indicum (strain ATCC BAA-1389 / DSM 22839 / S5) TaxID=653733 RepID=E6W283_DESIS|nr:uracil phosphoribosyltransferase [Desulfurispirillum indicum]ADU65541.1 uracil phosphoribosyltransferase [Desulfurispirillum indicum S5]UCZ57625.1 uracil phosphoribosyltransferase [Desulfurispirillum indicum]
MQDVFIVDHPLIQHKLTYIRDRNTSTKMFKELLEEVSMLMAYEITRNLELEDTDIETPLVPTRGKVLGGKKLAVVPILRAGLGMVRGIENLIPNVRIGHLGMYRDHDTLQPVVYYNKLPQDMHQRDVILVDPMLATGGSAVIAVDELKKAGARSVKFMALIAAPEGIRHFFDHHPDVPIYVAAVDEKLSEQGYILPGLGDAGDRIFGTR